jgi:outer membrane protein OmpA-like peptidoglycan-associated protein
MNKSSLFWLLVLLGWILLGLFFCNKYICQNASMFTGASAIVPAAATPAVSNAWNYSDKNLNVSSDQYFRFKESDATNHLPLSSDVSSDLNETKAYMVGHPKRKLTITGYYKDSETNTSVLANLGLARASHVKNYISSLGFPSGQLDTDSKLVSDASWFSGDTLVHGADFTFSELGDNNTRLAAIKARLLGKPLTVYFATNQKVLNFDEKQRTDLGDIIYYLDNVKESKLDISGHTDNKGALPMNTTLSQGRAEFVSNYLNKNASIDAARMIAKGFGPTKPIAPNETSAGKAKNRRVEITLN